MSEKSYKREVGSGLLAMAFIVSLRYWTLDDIEMIKAFAGAYNGLMLTLVPTGCSTFAFHHKLKHREKP